MTAKMEMNAVLKAVDNMSPVLKKISRNLAPMGKQFSAIGKNAAAVGGGLGRLMAPLAAIGGVASVAGIGALVKNTAALGDKMANLSKQIGISAQSLQEYSHAAGFSNMESDEFLRSLEKMAAGMGKLRAGTGPLVSGLKNISPALLKQLQAANSNEEAFELMLEAIRKVPDENKKLYLATTFFGEAGKNMVHFAAQGKEGLAAFRAEAHRLGLVLDETAQEDSQKFINSMAGMKNAVKGVGLSIGSALLPVITPIIEKLSAWIAANRELISVKVGEHVKALGEQLARIDFDKLLKGVSDVIGVIGKLAGWVLSSKKAFIGLVVVLNSRLILSVLSLGKSIFGLLPALGGMAKGLLGIKANGVKAAAGNAALQKSNFSLGASFKALGLKIKIVGAAMLGFGKKAALAMIGGLKGIALAFKGLTATMLANPITLIITGIAVAALLIVKYWKPIKAFFAGLWGNITKKFSEAWQNIKQGVAETVAWVRGVWAGIVNFFGGLKDKIVGVLSAVWEGIRQGAKAAFGWLKGVWTPITDFFGGIKDKIVGTLSAAWESVKQGVAAVVEWITGRWSKSLEFYKSLGASVAAIFTEAWESVKNIVRGTIDYIKDLIGSLGKWLENSKVFGAIMKAVNGIRGILNLRGKDPDGDSEKPDRSKAKPPPKTWLNPLGFAPPLMFPQGDGGQYAQADGGMPVPTRNTQPGALGQAMAGKTPVNEAKAEVVVRFENAPAGTAVNSKTRGRGLDLGTDVGYATPAGLR